MGTSARLPSDERIVSIVVVNKLARLLARQGQTDMARVYQCSDCRCDLTKSVDAPMLRYKVWMKLAKADECLCHKCLYNRAIARNVPIHLADLMPCAYNLFKTPHSWFDLFLSAEDQKPSPELVREWKAAIAWLGSADAVEAALQGKLPAILVG